MLGIQPIQRGGEPIGVALAAHLAVGDDVDASALQVADREQRGVVLRLGQIGLGYPPQLRRTHARHAALGHRCPIDQPVRLRVAADDRRLQQLRHWCVDARRPRRPGRRGAHRRWV